MSMPSTSACGERSGRCRTRSTGWSIPATGSAPASTATSSRRTPCSPPTAAGHGSTPTPHVAIVARAFDIRVVGRVAEATRQIEAGDVVILDGEHGTVLIRPRADILQSVAATIAARTRRRAYYETLRDLPAVTRDGVEITLLLNAGLLLDLTQLPPTGAAGVGLFRTEIPPLTRNGFADVAHQTAVYPRAYEQAEERPIVFRTLDIGGDKELPYLAHTEEDNPAMGWRAIRIGLDRPAMLRQQLRALLRAAAGRDPMVKFPMIAAITDV